MRRQIVLVGLTTACAIALGASLPLGASAAPTESNTGFTCVAGKGTLDAHCDPGSSGTSGHVAVKAGESTQLTLANIGNWILHTTIAASEFTVTATGAECVECMAENHEEVVEGKTVMDVTGSGGHLRFTGATTNLANCVVKNGEWITKPLKMTSTAATGSKNVVLEPVTPPIFAVIEFASSPVCPLGSSITVNGIAHGTTKGATVTVSTGAGELTVGKQVASLTGEGTLSAGTTGSGTMNPVSLTAA